MVRDTCVLKHWVDWVSAHTLTLCDDRHCSDRPDAAVPEALGQHRPPSLPHVVGHVQGSDTETHQVVLWWSLCSTSSQDWCWCSKTEKNNNLWFHAFVILQQSFSRKGVRANCSEYGLSGLLIDPALLNPTRRSSTKTGQGKPDFVDLLHSRRLKYILEGLDARLLGERHVVTKRVCFPLGPTQAHLAKSSQCSSLKV